MNTSCFRSHFLHPRFWILWIGLGAFRIVIQLPYKLNLFLGHMLGIILFYLAKKRRHIADRNIELCFPRKSIEERHSLLKKNFISIGIGFFEIGISWWWPKSRLNKLINQVEGLDILEKLQIEGSGIILLSAHFTTLEIGGALLSQYHPVNAMYKEHSNKLFNYIQCQGRERHASQSITINQDNVRGMIALLRAGHSVWYAPDQNYANKFSIFVPLFNIQAATVTATSRFAKLGKAKVVPFTQERLPKGSGYKLTIHPPLENFPSEYPESDCRRINKEFESMILKNPEQYLWVHRRFKSRPLRETSLYD